MSSEPAARQKYSTPTASSEDIIGAARFWPGCGWLKDRIGNVYSQAGEDGIVNGIFSKIGTPRHRNEWAMEVGAYDGITYSNTRQLLNRGWDVVYVECDDESFADLKDNTKDYPTAYCFHEVLEPSGRQSIDGILARAGAPEELDLLSLDIDGGEGWVWDGIREYRFAVVICEIFHAASTLNLVHSVALAKGYSMVACTPYNAICVANEYMDSLLDTTDYSAQLRGIA